MSKSPHLDNEEMTKKLSDGEFFQESCFSIDMSVTKIDLINFHEEAKSRMIMISISCISRCSIDGFQGSEMEKLFSRLSTSAFRKTSNSMNREAKNHQWFGEKDYG